MSYAIGQWSFDPASGELSRGTERRRLEPRAARLLELLCRADGEVVSQERLIAEVWNGRSLSENSVAVVIGQLRRALDDERRAIIENVPKRGYRLVTPGQAEAAPERRLASGWLPILLLLLVAAGAAALLLAGRSSGLPAVAVADVVNETGNPALDAHARATSELIVDQLSQRDFTVRRGIAGGDLIIRPRLVMWNGAPYLGITATDQAGVVAWSAMMPGAPHQVPANAAKALDELRTRVVRR